MSEILNKLNEIVDVMAGFAGAKFVLLRDWGEYWHIHFRFEGTFRNKAIRELKHMIKEEWNLDGSYKGESFDSDGIVRLIFNKKAESGKEVEKG